MFKSISLQAIVTLNLVVCFATAQDGLPDPLTCANPKQTFDGCRILQGKSAECGSISVDDQAGIISCFCTQEVLSSIVDCESEIRQCQRDSSGDSTYQDILSAWQSKCGPKITFTPTTPALSTFTSYPGLASCEHVYSACATWSSQGSVCSSQFTASKDYYACQCKPEVLAQASACQVGGAECLGEELVSATLYENQFCGSVSLTGTVKASSTRKTQTQAQTTVANGGVTSAPSTTPFVPSTVAAKTVVATTTSSSSATLLKKQSGLLAVVLSAMIKVALF